VRWPVRVRNWAAQPVVQPADELSAQSAVGEPDDGAHAGERHHLPRGNAHGLEQLGMEIRVRVLDTRSIPNPTGTGWIFFLTHG
jgi:hypothetical protein